jgi:hypothetical protein
MARDGFNDERYYEAQGLNPDGTVNPAYDKLLDLNNLIDYPSAEAIAMYIWEILEINPEAQLANIKVWESPDCMVSYIGGIL